MQSQLCEEFYHISLSAFKRLRPKSYINNNFLVRYQDINPLSTDKYYSVQMYRNSDNTLIYALRIWTSKQAREYLRRRVAGETSDQGSLMRIV